MRMNKEALDELEKMLSFVVKSLDKSLYNEAIETAIRKTYEKYNQHF